MKFRTDSSFARATSSALLILATFVFNACFWGNAARAETLRILPLGDSTTAAVTVVLSRPAPTALYANGCERMIQTLSC